MPQTKDRPATDLGLILTRDQKQAIFNLELMAGDHPGAARKWRDRLGELDIFELFPQAQQHAIHEQTDELMAVGDAIYAVLAACIDNARGG